MFVSLFRKSIIASRIIKQRTRRSNFPSNDFLGNRRVDSGFVRRVPRNSAEIFREGLKIRQNMVKEKFNEISETDLDDYSYYDDAAYPFRSRETARSMLARLGYNGRFRRITRGIHDECCVKPCTVDELRSYCARN